MANTLAIPMWMDSETKKKKKKQKTPQVVGSCLQIGLFLFLTFTWV